MADRTSDKKFFELTDNMPNWHHYHNYNIDVMNGDAFKIKGLTNVNIESLQDKSILKWDAKTLSWNIVYSREAT